MLILNRSHMEKIFSMENAIEAAKYGFRLCSQNKTVVPLRTHIGIPKHQGENLFMPSYIEDINSSGIKVVTIFPKNVDMGKSSINATMILLDGETGEVCCILDGTYLTQLRTGALSGAATDLLARKNARIAAVIGAGGQAQTQIEALLTVRNLECIRIFDISTDRAKALRDRIIRDLGGDQLEILATESIEETIYDADIITAVTTSKNPVFKGELVKKGAHINAVGAYRPDMQEIDEDLIKKADKILVDSKEAVLAEAGDFIIPINKGSITREIIDGEIGELLLSKVAGREKEEEITLFKTVGMAAQDLVIAERIYKKALEAGIGINV